jgi:hypothetical protein
MAEKSAMAREAGVAADTNTIIVVAPPRGNEGFTRPWRAAIVPAPFVAVRL